MDRKLFNSIKVLFVFIFNLQNSSPIFNPTQIYLPLKKHKLNETKTLKPKNSNSNNQF